MHALPLVTTVPASLRQGSEQNVPEMRLGGPYVTGELPGQHAVLPTVVAPPTGVQLVHLPSAAQRPVPQQSAFEAHATPEARQHWKEPWGTPGTPLIGLHEESVSQHAPLPALKSHCCWLGEQNSHVRVDVPRCARHVIGRATLVQGHSLSVTQVR